MEAMLDADGVQVDASRITREQIAEWRALQGQGMNSAIGEYTPEEFWTLLDAYEAITAGVPEPRAVTPQEDAVLRRAALRSAKVVSDGVLGLVKASDEASNKGVTDDR